MSNEEQKKKASELYNAIFKIGLIGTILSLIFIIWLDWQFWLKMSCTSFFVCILGLIGGALIDININE